MMYLKHIRHAITAPANQINRINPFPFPLTLTPSTRERNYSPWRG